MTYERKYPAGAPVEDRKRIRDIVSVSLNTVERRYLEALKRYYRTGNDSTALKSEAFRIFKQIRIFERVMREK